VGIFQGKSGNAFPQLFIQPYAQEYSHTRIRCLFQTAVYAARPDEESL
jgi:hypothetical protein